MILYELFNDDAMKAGVANGTARLVAFANNAKQGVVKFVVVCYFAYVADGWPGT